MGVMFALTAALFWALATSLYRQMAGYWSPASLALIKSVVSVVLFLLWFAGAGLVFWQHEATTLVWLLISGVIGIAIGDTAIFYALYRMNERETLIVAETAAPIFVVLAAFVLLSESLSLLQLAGVVLVIVGVDSVIGLRRVGTRGSFDKIGVAFALLAASCQAFGMIVSRLFLTTTDISAEETAFWRLLGATLVLPVWIVLRREKLKPRVPLNTPAVVRLMTAILLGTFFGILLLQLAVASLPAGLAQALIATSIVFAAVIGLVRGDSITRGQWLGVVIAVMGVALIVL